MTHTLTEDDLYRSSTQYRLWSFSPENLSALRKKTHDLAIERARQYDSSLSRRVTSGDEGGKQNSAANGEASECLTEEEELWLVQRYCDQVRTTSDRVKWPINVKATAVQYLKRFYLSNSCLTYPPKEIYKTVLFLACKTEATHMTLSEYARRISTEPDVILAPEYKVMQALRFTLDVRQPNRGLKGVLMELLNMAAGMTGETNGVETRGAKQLQQDMLDLKAPPDECKTRWKLPYSADVTTEHLEARVNDAYHAARAILDGPGLLTDVYFLYTPSQILLAALTLADTPLTDFYLDTKLPMSSELRPKILATIHACADVLASFSADQIMSKDERAALEEKLGRCRDPSTKDLVKVHAAMKRGADDEDKAERKRLEREKSTKEGEDLFGPSLPITNAANGG